MDARKGSLKIPKFSEQKMQKVKKTDSIESSQQRDVTNRKTCEADRYFIRTAALTRNFNRTNSDKAEGFWIIMIGWSIISQLYPNNTNNKSMDKIN